MVTSQAESVLPRPPEELHVPDRSHRRPIGRALRPGAFIDGGQSPEDARNVDRKMWQLLRARLEPVHESASGCWFRDDQAAIWFRNPFGELFLLIDAIWVALDSQGFAWFSSGGDLFTWAPDGTMVRLQDDGTLVAVGNESRERLLGEDGRFYLTGHDGGLYTEIESGSFYGVDAHGEYFPAPFGSGFSSVELVAARLEAGSGRN